MIILRQKEFGFRERIQELSNGAFIGAISSLPFAIPIGIIAKFAKGSFKKAVGYTILAGALLGALIGYSSAVSEEKIKKYLEWIKDKENRRKLGEIVNKNYPPINANKLQKFEEEANRLNDSVECCGYEISACYNSEKLITALGSYIYSALKGEIPEDNPLPVISIKGYFEEDGLWILWYSKKDGWKHDGKTVNGPKEFILDCIENKIDMFEVEQEDWFPEYKEDFIKLVKKYL